MSSAVSDACVETFRRLPTRRVRVGTVAIGGGAPIVVQSMTVTDTQDTAATVAQIVALERAGCEIVRVTAPSRADAKNLEAIKAELGRLGSHVPLVADIHFTPNAALEACEFVEKVRVNPGNYADRKHFAVKEYSDEEYGAELERLEKAFTPLVQKALERGVALRIGTNHGSLSDRIMNRFGDSPLGMAESALEFVRIAERQGFHEMVISAKASNVKVMVESYRLLAKMMAETGVCYPLHLGVTEAGDGEDGRVKSAIGIGMLLLEGIGDTIRVSLTEDPCKEVPVCREIVAVVDEMTTGGRVETWRRPVAMPARRAAAQVAIDGFRAGGEEPPRVLMSLQAPFDEEVLLELLRRRPLPMSEMRPEGFELLPRSLQEARAALAVSKRLAGEVMVLIRTNDLSLARALNQEGARLSLDVSVATLGKEGLATAVALHPTVVTLCGHHQVGLQKLVDRLAHASARVAPETLVAFEPGSGSVLRTEAYRALGEILAEHNPLLLRAAHGSPANLVQTSIELGSLIADGIGDAVLAPADPLAPLDTLRLLYNILQASGARISKTEFISCPSCGRTLFDLETTTARIKEKTAHLKGVKIAIMGCIVNGPGEMADADFGYVGASPGTVHLFVGKDLVERGIPSEIADERLIELIKERGRWSDPPAARC